MNKGAIRHNTGRNGAGFDLIHERLWVEYLEIFPSRNAAVGLVVLAVVLSLPVPLECFDAIASPGAMREWAMYPMREVR